MHLGGLDVAEVRIGPADAGFDTDRGRHDQAFDRVVRCVAVRETVRRYEIDHVFRRKSDSVVRARVFRPKFVVVEQQVVVRLELNFERTRFGVIGDA